MSGKIIRFVAIALMGLTVAIHLLGAVGSSCVALGAEKYASMAALAPYKWLYQALALLTLAASIWGIRATVSLARGKAGSYKTALLVLLVTLVLAGIQMAASQALRGKSQPNDVRVYTTLFTLAVFLLLRIPRIWQKAGFERGADSASGSGAGMALLLAGVLTLTVHLWAGPSHMLGGVNYADAWRTAITWLGWALSGAGVGLSVRALLAGAVPARPQAEAKPTQG
ncbi:MAG: hypothetical protein PHS96_13805 [Anaerolineales bacterium]|nr:hypothetical protein [Anaerolineales bacterium]